MPAVYLRARRYNVGPIFSNRFKAFQKEEGVSQKREIVNRP
jgi:hypothetical protein